MTERSPKPKGPANAASVPVHGQHKQQTAYDANPSGIVVGLTLSLSWQLALVVLAPILGGHFLDDKAKTGPWFTLGGFVLAMILMVVVIRRALQQLNKYMNVPDIDKDDESPKT